MQKYVFFIEYVPDLHVVVFDPICFAYLGTGSLGPRPLRPGADLDPGPGQGLPQSLGLGLFPGPKYRKITKT